MLFTMLIRKLKDSQKIIAGDKTELKELLHPNRNYQFSGRYSLAHASVKPGCSSLKHKLKTDEVYYILSGQGKISVDNETADVEAGDAVDIPPGSVQSIRNTGETDLIFLCIVDPAWQTEDEGILE